MTEPHETPDEYEEAADRWLSAQHRHLVDHLDATLDVEAGLQDILLHSQHAALVERLDTEIDIEANLAAIISPEKKSIGPDTEPPPARQSTDAAASSVLPAVKRIVLRTNPAVMRACLRFIIAIVLDLDLRLVLARTADPARDFTRALASTCALARDLAFALAHTLDRDLDLHRIRGLERDLDRARELERLLDVARAHDFAHKLDRAGDLTRDLAFAFARDLDLARAHARAHDLARALARALDRDFASDLARDLTCARDLGHALTTVDEYMNGYRQGIEDALGCYLPRANAEAVEAFLNDFTDADLRGAELNSIDLTGVRWSESGTRWPPGMDIKALKQRSTSQGNGVWVVGRGGGQATVPDSVGVL